MDLRDWYKGFKGSEVYLTSFTPPCSRSLTVSRRWLNTATASKLCLLDGAFNHIHTTLFELCVILPRTLTTPRRRLDTAFTPHCSRSPLSSLLRQQYLDDDSEPLPHLNPHHITCVYPPAPRLQPHDIDEISSRRVISSLRLTRIREAMVSASYIQIVLLQTGALMFEYLPRSSNSACPSSSTGKIRHGTANPGGGKTWLRLFSCVRDDRGMASASVSTSIIFSCARLLILLDRPPVEPYESLVS